MIIILMGVAGSGKTTIGARLADALQCAFLDGDTLHPPGNIERMSRGLPLTDADRAPWLEAIRLRLVEAARRGESIVVACSALRQSYRDHLAAGIPVIWVYLKGTEQLIQARLEHRTGHFAKPEILASQIEALEEPLDAIVVDIALPPDAMVEQLLSSLA